jgi:hypothetical protein
MNVIVRVIVIMIADIDNIYIVIIMLTRIIICIAGSVGIADVVGGSSGC